MLETAGDLVETKVLGDAIHGPGAGVGLEGADEEPARVVFVVGAGVVVAHDRKSSHQPRYRFEQGVVVLAGMQGHIHSDRRRQVPGPHAAAQHHAVRVDIAVFRGHAGDAAPCGTDVGDRQVLKDARAGGAGTPGQRVGDIHRVGVAVGRNVNAAEHVWGMQQRNPGLDGCGRDHIHLQPEHLGHRGAAPQFLKTLFVGGDGDGTAAPVAGGLGRFRPPGAGRARWYSAPARSC